MDLDTTDLLESDNKITINSFYRKKVVYTKDTIEFQATEWVDLDENIEIDTGFEPEIESKYLIKIFGVTQDSHSICCNVKNFTPFFYIKVPQNWKSTNIKTFIDNLFSTPSYRYSKPYCDLLKYKKHILIDKCVLQMKKDFFGFNALKEFKFLRLTFDNAKAMKNVIYKIKNHNNNSDKTRIKGISFDIQLYETNIETILRYIHIKNLTPSGWILASKITLSESISSKCQIEIDVDWKNVNHIDRIKNAPFLQASFDIETYSHDDSFPSALHPENSIFQISTVFKSFTNSNFTLKHALCLKKCSQIFKKEDNIPVFLETFDTEKQLLTAWVKLIQNMDPDILYTYNGDQFDFKYIYDRAVLLGIEDTLSEIGRLKDVETVPCKMKIKSFKSSARGDTEFMRMLIPGRINFDLLIYIKMEYKEDSYKLDYIAEKYVGENKNPITPNMMFDAYRQQDPEKVKDVMEYCIQDSMLPQKISDNLHILQNLISMSNISYVPLKYLIEQGQQIKSYSQIARKTRSLGFLIPFIESYKKEDSEDTEKFTGATVLPPETGAYFEPVTVCDFASLYPSIIRAHNFCYSTIVLDPSYLEDPQNTFKTVEWVDTDKKTDKETKFSFSYVQNVPGVLPEILSELAISRTNYKKLMKETKDPFEKEIYNKCQNAVKVSMNSVYGFLAAYKLPCKPIAASVTAIGRTMIDDSKNFIENNYPGSMTVYGDTDSVFIKFKTETSELFKTETDRINKHTVITENDKKYLNELKTKCIQESIDIGKEAGKAVTRNLFKNPISLDYEKVYCPLLMYKKKKYAGYLYSENANEPDKFDKKGIVLTKRDNFKLLQKAYKHILDIYVEKGKNGNDKVNEYIKDVFNSIKNRQINLNDLVITKTLKSNYKNGNLPHVAVAKKIVERGEKAPPRSNDKISYLIIDTGVIKKQAQYLKVEEPDYVIRNNLKLDTEFYITFIMNPLCEIMGLFLENPQLIFKKYIKEYKEERKKLLSPPKKVVEKKVSIRKRTVKIVKKK